MGEVEIEPVLHGFFRWTFPTQLIREAETVDLSRMQPSATRLARRAAIKLQSFVKAAILVISAPLPPERESIGQPGFQYGRKISGFLQGMDIRSS